METSKLESTLRIDVAVQRQVASPQASPRPFRLVASFNSNELSVGKVDLARTSYRSETESKPQTSRRLSTNLRCRFYELHPEL